MDSMRNLHTSLPGSTPRTRRTAAPPQDLLQTFRSAALSVTKLYKLAAEDLAGERQAGYQDAIYDLLSYMDKENIGLETGEGWSIRQWATERQDTSAANQTASEEEDERDDDRDEGARSVEDESTLSSDITPPEKESPKEKQPDTPASTDIPSRPISQTVTIQPPRSDNFNFQSSHPYPEYEMSTGQVQGARSQSHSIRPNSPSARPARRNNQVARPGTRPRQLGIGAGNKRKVQLNDFFDFGNLGIGKDPFAPGPKRPRPT